MKRASSARVIRALAFASLAVLAFEACTSSSSDTVTPPAGPADFDLALDQDQTLACDDSLVVALTATNITLRPPYYCGTTPQCGSVRVSLLETEDGTPLITPTSAATATVQLDLSTLVSPANADAPTLGNVHFIKAELLTDSLGPYRNPEGGVFTKTVPVTLSPSPSPCPANNGGAGGQTGVAGSSSAGASSGGASGEGGAPGAAGTSSSGEGGVAGEGTSSAGAGG